MNKIANKIKKVGGNLYLVGGAVRDEIMNSKIHDEDYCVTGITAEEFIKLFPEAKIRGKSFEVFDLNGKEFAMARTENKIGVGHKEFSIITGKNITIEQDLARRDVTINSIAKDVITGKIIDPYRGIEDIKNKILRATTEKFKEDPLRVYRVARLSATLEFTVEKNTLLMMQSLKKELSSLSAERVFNEFRKALNSDKPSIFFNTLREANVLDIHFKEIAKLIGAEQPEEYHPEGDSYNHTMNVVDIASKLTKDEKIRYSALVHDLGKGLTPKEEYPHHYNHDKLGEGPVRELSNRLKVPTSWKKAGIISAKEHMRAGIFEQMKPAKQVDLIEKLEKSELGLDGMQIVVMADKTRKNEIIEVKIGKIGHEILKAVTATDVMKKYELKEGPEVKEKLRQERIAWIKKIQIAKLN